MWTVELVIDVAMPTGPVHTALPSPNLGSVVSGCFLWFWAGQFSISSLQEVPKCKPGEPGNDPGRGGGWLATSKSYWSPLQILYSRIRKLGINVLHTTTFAASDT